MNKSLFPQLLYCKSLDTALISQSSEVDELANRIYDMLLDHELKNKSAKVKIMVFWDFNYRINVV